MIVQSVPPIAITQMMTPLLYCTSAHAWCIRHLIRKQSWILSISHQHKMPTPTARDTTTLYSTILHWVSLPHSLFQAN